MEYRKLLLASTFTALLQPFQFLTVTFWVQDQYPDKDILFVSILAAARGSSMLLMSFVGGAIADRFQRRRVILGTDIANAIVTLLIALTMIANPLGDATFGLIFVLVFCVAGILAVDAPARSASIPSVVKDDEIPSAIGLNMLVVWISFPIVLPLVGRLNADFDPGHVYLSSLAISLIILPIVLSLRYDSKGDPSQKKGMIRDIRAGLSYSVGHSAILAVISLVVVLHVIGMPGPGMLGPLWMTDVLGLSRSEFGLMAMTWGLGAITGSLLLSVKSGYARRGSMLCFAVILFAIAAITFAHSRIIPVTAIANFALGFSMAATMVTAQTLLQFFSSEEMRGRVMGLMPLIMGMSQLFALPVGLAAQATSLELVLPVLAWVALVSAASIVLLRPELRAARGVAQVKPASPLAEATIDPTPEPV